MPAWNPDKPLSPDQLETVLQQAKRERWTRLALIGPRWTRGREDLIDQGWPGDRVFALTDPLTTLPSALLELANLTTLNLSYNAIGEAGAEALAGAMHLANLTTLNLGSNAIGEPGRPAWVACLPRGGGDWRAGWSRISGC
ncbi:MAG: hypothetical protein FLDDKLPJ_02252 [Phycisphaerae bacterium]|nr:hypothetical protein [Phycisphaerae bacterium]